MHISHKKKSIDFPTHISLNKNKNKKIYLSLHGAPVRLVRPFSRHIACRVRPFVDTVLSVRPKYWQCPAGRSSLSTPGPLRPTCSATQTSVSPSWGQLEQVPVLKLYTDMVSISPVGYRFRISIHPARDKTSFSRGVAEDTSWPFAKDPTVHEEIRILCQSLGKPVDLTGNNQLGNNDCSTEVKSVNLGGLMVLYRKEIDGEMDHRRQKVPEDLLRWEEKRWTRPWETQSLPVGDRKTLTGLPCPHERPLRRDPKTHKSSASPLGRPWEIQSLPMTF